ncbi:MAG: 50S ribosomal protein L15 [Deltaproteobacteria bacterium]|nr:MAG: 50S ribosomal protein L15 [Deltaproteobacteria bacterium]
MSEESTEQANDVPILSRLRPPAGAVHRKKRKGRGPGSGLGKTSGKGQKGQKARSPGNFQKLGFEGGQTALQRRLPKFGFHNPFSKKIATLNVSDLGRFDAGTTVTVDSLREAGLVRGRFDGVKVLGTGEIDRALTVQAHAFSKGAIEKIEKAGGKAVALEDPSRTYYRGKNAAAPPTK